MRLMLAALAAVTFAACAHTETKPEPVEAPLPKPVAVATPAPAAPDSCAVDKDCKDGHLCIRSQCVAITADLAECQLLRVHFEFNQSVLSQDDMKGLERMARCLRADRAMHVMIEGNADERGTEEYNLMLGSQRASSVERSLETLGASKKQLDTISYGYEKPVCTEHNEACWEKNRRAAVVPEKGAPAPAPAPKQKAAAPAPAPKK